MVAALALSGCGGGGAPKVAELTAVAADSGLVPVENGFSFANFPATATQAWFNEEDLVTMFGGAACVDGVTTPCVPTAQAAQWAQMVNEARMSGHCEGLAVQSAARFTGGATPKTVELRNEGDVTHGIMRAFATQFFPEVQKASNEWAKESLNDILNELSRAFAAKDVSYTMGLYTPTGGHAVLPYAIEFSGENLAVVKVYDSNWPGMERYVVIDLEAQTWFFSFSASDPQKDECAWTGTAGDLDIAPMSARTEAQCPFCGDDAQVTKNVLLIRSASLDWTLKTAEGTFSPADVTAVPADLRARSIRTAACETVVRIPEFVLYTESQEFELELPDTASAYVSTPDAVVKVETDGKKARKPIVFSDKRVKTDDESTVLTVASDNAVARVEVPTSDITVGENVVSVDTGGGQVATTPETPQIVVTAGNGTSAPVAQPVENLVTVVPEVKPELVPETVKPGLTEATARDLSNEAYAASVAATPVVPVSAPPVTTTTVAEQRNVAAPAATTTTVRSTTTTRPSATTTTRPGATTTTVAATTPVTAVAVTTTTVSPTTTRATTTSAAPTSSTIPRATITVLVTANEGDFRPWSNQDPDSWGNYSYFDPNNDQNNSMGSCGPSHGQSCASVTYQVPIGWDFIFDWAQYNDQGNFEMQCPGSSTWYPPGTSYGNNTEARRIGRCWFNVSGAATVRVRPA
jgi:hypothetical protein